MYADQALDRTRFGIGVDPALALKMLLLFDFVPLSVVVDDDLLVAVVVVLLLLVVVVVVVALLEILTLFFEGGVPNKAPLGDLGVNFLRLLLGVDARLEEDDVVVPGTEGVELLPSRRTCRAAGDGGVAVVVICERVLRPEEVLPFSLACLSDCALLPMRVLLSKSSSLDSRLLLRSGCGSSPCSNSTSRASFQHTLFPEPPFL